MKIILSNTTHGAYNGVKDALKSNLRDCGQHIVLVPDRFTASVERGLLQSLDLTSTTNISVMSFTRLANKLIGKDIKKCLTPEGSVMLLTKVVEDKRGELLYYGKASNVDGFASELYAAVTAIRNSGISPQELLQNADKMPVSLRRKASDLALIYDGYLEALQNKHSDSSTRLEACAQFLKGMRGASAAETAFAKKINPKTTHFYCVDFYSFKAPETAILQELSLSALSLTVGLVDGDKFANCRIYPHKTLKSLLAFEGDKAEIVRNDEVLHPALDKISKYLFSYETDVERTENNGKVCLKVARDRSSEVLSLALDIVDKVKNGARYQNFDVFVSDIDDYAEEIKRVFKTYNIPFFVDKTELLEEQAKVRYLLSALAVVASNFRVDETLDFVKNPLFLFSLSDKLKSLKDKENAQDVETAIDDEYAENCVFKFENYVLKYSVNFGQFRNSFNYDDGSDDLGDVEIVRNQLAETLLPLTLLGAHNIGEFTAGARAFLANADDASMKYTEEISQISAYYKKCAEQVDKKIQSVLDEIDEVLHYDLDIKSFDNIVRGMLKTLKIALVPTYLDCVFVGDADSRFLGGGDVYILGANSGKLPKVSGGGAVLTAKDEQTLSGLGLEICPDEKQRLYIGMLSVVEILKKPRGKLVVSYPETAPSGELSPSTVIAELRGMLCENGKPIDIARIDFLRISSFSNSERDKTVGAMFSTEQACLYQILKNATHGVAQGDEFEIYRSAYKFVADGDKLKLENAIDEPEFLDKPQNSVKAEYASVSRLERFFTCPYSYFLNYDLKLKKRHEGDFDGNENGIILHYIFEKFYCGLRDGNVNCDNIEDMAYKFFDEAIVENKFQRLMQKSATARVLYRVREEGAGACRDLYNIYLRSEFKPTYIEAKIGNGEIKPLSINVDGRDVKLVGKIDRVDTYDDNFIIVDYKTYKSADLSFDEIYYGEKIQLYIYMKAVMNGSNLKPAGVFYLPIFASFTNADENVNRYKFKGQASNNIDILSKIDSMILEDPEASIAPYKANKGKLKAETHFGENEFEAVSNYVCDLAASGIKKIEEGYIKPAPLKGACDMCNFAEMCPFVNSDIRETGTVKLSAFGVQGEEDNEDE